MRLKLLTLLILFSTLCACDYAANEFYILTNNTDYPLEVNYQLFSDSSKTSIEVEPHSSETFYLYSDLAFHIEQHFQKDFLNHFFELSILVNDSISVTKDIMIKENWQFTHLDAAGEGFDYVFVFELDSLDLKIGD